MNPKSTPRLVTFSPSERAILREGRIKAEHPKVRMRLWILWLIDKGSSLIEGARLADCSVNTVRAVVDLHREGGLERVMRYEPHRAEHPLTPFTDAIRASFDKQPAATLEEARARIEGIAGFTTRTESVSAFLKTLGYRRLKSASMPAKADPEAQEDFKKLCISSSLLRTSRHVWKKPKTASDKSSLSTLCTSFSAPFSDSSGPVSDSSCLQARGVNA